MLDPIRIEQANYCDIRVCTWNNENFKGKCRERARRAGVQFLFTLSPKTLFSSGRSARQTVHLGLPRSPDRTSRAPAHARPHVTCSSTRTNARQGPPRAHALVASFTTDSVLATPSHGHSIEHRLKNESYSFLASKISCLRVLAGRFFVLHWWDYKNLFEMKSLGGPQLYLFDGVYPGFFFCFYKFFLCALNQGIFILSYRVLNCRL